MSSCLLLCFSNRQVLFCLGKFFSTVSLSLSHARALVPLLLPVSLLPVSLLLRGPVPHLTTLFICEEESAQQQLWHKRVAQVTDTRDGLEARTTIPACGRVQRIIALRKATSRWRFTTALLAWWWCDINMGACMTGMVLGHGARMQAVMYHIIWFICDMSCHVQARTHTGQPVHRMHSCCADLVHCIKKLQSIPGTTLPGPRMISYHTIKCGTLPRYPRRVSISLSIFYFVYCIMPGV